MEWYVKKHDKDPMVNAVLNVAESISELAGATNSLLYAFKYSQGTGLSVAEAIEAAGQSIANAMPRDDTGMNVAEAIAAAGRSIVMAMPSDVYPTRPYSEELPDEDLADDFTGLLDDV